MIVTVTVTVKVTVTVTATVHRFSEETHDVQ
jgi:hypothetical protein